MLTNINILAGEPPKQTGNTEADMNSLFEYIRRLQRALELTLDQIDNALERGQKE